MYWIYIQYTNKLRINHKRDEIDQCNLIKIATDLDITL